MTLRKGSSQKPDRQVWELISTIAPLPGGCGYTDQTSRRALKGSRTFTWDRLYDHLEFRLALGRWRLEGQEFWASFDCIADLKPACAALKLSQQQNFPSKQEGMKVCVATDSLACLQCNGALDNPGEIHEWKFRAAHDTSISKNIYAPSDLHLRRKPHRLGFF